MRTIIFFVAVICCLMLSISPSYAVKQCIDSLPSDSFSFGDALATYDKYLVVGDPWANHVVIYTRDNDGKWLRTREILPLKDSTAYKVGSGFGNTIALDENLLIIGAFTVINPENNEAVNSKDFRENNGIFSTSTALYQTRLDRNTEVKRIDLPGISSKGVLFTGKVVAENGKIGFIFSQERPEKQIKRINQVYVLSDGKAHALPDGKLEYRLTSRVRRKSIYGSDIALKNNLLLVSIDRDKDRGGVWLFDLNSSQSKPQKLTIPLVAPAAVSVAISEQFIAISNSSLLSSPYLPNLSDTTLIRNIATGSIKIISAAGGVSLDDNILVRTRSIPDGNEYTTINDIPSVLEIFRLDDDATPHLIQKRSNIESALVQNRLLITVQKISSSRRICTEQMH